MSRPLKCKMHLGGTGWCTSTAIASGCWALAVLISRSLQTLCI